MPSPEDVVLQEVDKLMDDLIDRVFQLSQEKLIDDNKIDTGTLLKTGNVNRKFLEKEIVYPALYADITEFGRNPGQMPPPSALFKWVRRKLGIKNEAEIKRVSFAVAKAIEQRGLQPSPFIRNSFAQARREFGL